MRQLAKYSCKQNSGYRLSHVELSDFELRVGDTDVSSVSGLDPDKEKL